MFSLVGETGDREELERAKLAGSKDSRPNSTLTLQAGLSVDGSCRPIL